MPAPFDPEAASRPPLHVADPVLVFFKVSSDREALSHAIPPKVAERYDADLHSALSIREELARREHGVHGGRKSFAETADILMARMASSITNNRGAFLDVFLLHPERREPFISMAHSLGAEVVAMNVYTSASLRLARRTKYKSGPDKPGRAEPRTDRAKGRPVIRATRREPIDHILQIEDDLEPGLVFSRITKSLDRSLAARRHSQPQREIEERKAV